MRQSHLFTKTRKEAPSDEVSKNAQLLIRAGFVHKEMAGVYAFLPLGLRVLEKIKTIIREEMDAIGGQELHMTVLQDAELWKKSGRWDDEVIDVWFKSQLANKTEIGLGTTHEEPLTNVMKQYVKSYKDLPRAVYQIQTKFRNELRAKSGIMRGREFLMKDLYSFSKDEAEHNDFYAKSQMAYTRVFERLGLGNETFMTFASGGSFSKYSHEFQTISDAGEDTIYVDREKKLAINKEVYSDEIIAELGLNKENLEEHTSIEVGNIFTLGTRFSEPLGLVYADEHGDNQPVFMGSYGIGPSRVMGTIVELYNDEQGMKWPEAVAPFDIHLVSLCKDEVDVAKADELYEKLTVAGHEVLYDDRDARAGEKFADSDLIGIPKRLVVSPKTLEQGSVEVKMRDSESAEMVPLESVV